MSQNALRIDLLVQLCMCVSVYENDFNRTQSFVTIELLFRKSVLICSRRRRRRRHRCRRRLCISYSKQLTFYYYVFFVVHFSFCRKSISVSKSKKNEKHLGICIYYVLVSLNFFHSFFVFLFFRVFFFSLFLFLNGFYAMCIWSSCCSLA